MKKISEKTIARFAKNLYAKWSKYEGKHWGKPDSVSGSLYWIYGDLVFRTWEDTLNLYLAGDDGYPEHLFSVVFSDTLPNIYIYERDEEYVQNAIEEYWIDENELIAELSNI